MSETKFTTGPWFDWEDGVWLHEPTKLLSRYDDACLIAASPELYEALSGLVDATVRDANEHGISGFTGARLTDARAALAKARGEQ